MNMEPMDFMSSVVVSKDKAESKVLAALQSGSILLIHMSVFQHFCEVLQLQMFLSSDEE